MMDSYLLLQKKQELFSFSCTFFSSYCLRENARDEAVEAVESTLLTAAN